MDEQRARIFVHQVGFAVAVAVVLVFTVERWRNSPRSESFGDGRRHREAQLESAAPSVGHGVGVQFRAFRQQKVRQTFIAPFDGVVEGGVTLATFAGVDVGPIPHEVAEDVDVAADCGNVYTSLTCNKRIFLQTRK